eukprot:16663-Amphidinium_carterae.1
MEDNRVPRRASVLRHCAAADHLSVEGLAPFVLEIFGTIMRMPAASVRHLFITASCNIEENVTNFVKTAPAEGVQDAIGNRLLYLAQIGLLQQ